MNFGRMGLGFGRLGGPAGGAAFSPPSLPNLAFWHDPSRASSVTLNVADVAQIDDLSGNARHAVQGTAGQQPAYTASGINSKGTIAYTGANNDTLALASALGIGRNVPGFTLAGVARFAAFAATNRLFTVLGAGGVTRFVIQTFITTGRINCTTRRLDGDATVTSNTAALAFTANQAAFFCFACDYSAAAIRLQIDGAGEDFSPAWAGGNGNTSDTDSSTAPNYGRVGGVVLSGDLAETFGWQRMLTAQEIADLRAYVQAKWATP